MFESLADGGYWAIPANESIWKHDKINKVLACIHGEQDDLFHKITVVCGKLGYTTTHALENLNPLQVQQHMATVQLTEDMFGSGKTFTRTSSPAEKKYLWRPLTPEDLANFKISLAKLPRKMRWKGKPTPQCDFCSHDQPTVSYAANRLSTGEVRDCWRWLACAGCHDAITRNDFKSLERRSANAFGDAQLAGFAVKVVLLAFHDHAVRV